MVTIYHWDLPQALVDSYGGWESPRIIDDYVAYAQTLFSRFGNKVKYWITLNEQNIFTSLGWLTAQHPPGHFDDRKMFYQVNHHAFMAHAKAVLKYRKWGQGTHRRQLCLYPVLRPGLPPGKCNAKCTTMTSRITGGWT